MGKNPEQVVSKEWEKAIWEVNRILAALRRDVEKKSVGGGNVTNVTKQIVVEEDETLHWVL